MNITYLLLGITFIIILIIIWLFMWAVKSDQFDDLEGPAYQILMDDDDNKTEPDNTPSESTDEQEDQKKVKKQ